MSHYRVVLSNNILPVWTQKQKFVIKLQSHTHTHTHNNCVLQKTLIPTIWLCRSSILLLDAKTVLSVCAQFQVRATKVEEGGVVWVWPGKDSSCSSSVSFWSGFHPCTVHVVWCRSRWKAHTHSSLCVRLCVCVCDECVVCVMCVSVCVCVCDECVVCVMCVSVCVCVC